MNFSSLGPYASNLTFGNSGKTIKQTAKGFLPEIPELKLPNLNNLSFSEWGAAYDKRNASIQSYKQQLNDLFFDSNGKILPAVESFLDNQVFEIKTGGKNGCVIHSTIKDYLRQSIHSPETVDGKLFHGTINPSNIDNIIQNGFDINKISSGRTRLGPGFYFADYGSAMNYGSVLQVDAKGIVAGADNAFYENVTDSSICKKVADFIGLNADKCDDSETCYSFPAKLINEYSRQFIVENLGIDALRGWGGNGPADYCICVLNPKILSNVKRT